jgi:hypothetical protein
MHFQRHPRPMRQRVQVAGVVVPRVDAVQRQLRSPPFHHALELGDARSGRRHRVVRVERQRQEPVHAPALQLVQRRVGVGIPVAHREREGHVVPPSLQPLRQPAPLERGPADDRRAAADLGVVFPHLARALPRDGPSEEGLADGSARALEDLGIGEEPNQERAHRVEGVRAAEVEEKDSCLQTVREKTCFSPSWRFT